ncbi:MAG: cation:dicarboxylase symporter family transporter, partial [Planctomycetes bacterium]|nr:cation:dicarboxylase symporter family transporter [Planctomycetota bacterium]
MSFTLRVLLALVAGLLLGIGVSLSATPWIRHIPDLVEPIGLLFVNAIRMTVIPLVVASLIAGVASMRSAQAVGRLGGRAFAWFLIALAAATVFGAACAYPLLARLAIDPAVAESLRAGAASTGQAAAQTAQQLPTFSRWLTDLVPVNPFKAAADGSILPLIVFALAFGLSLTVVAAPRRDAVIDVLRGIADAMLALVGWVLKLTPVGVFALAVPLAARMGLAAAGALLYYVALLSAICGAFVVLMYP